MTIEDSMRHGRRHRMTGLVGAILLLGGLAAPTWAEIPPGEAVGLLEDTRPGVAHLSPLFGMVAVRSGILANIRFYGNYPGRGLDLKDYRPGDGTSALLQFLFPSPDGVNFVANSRDKDPIGQIAREAMADRRGEGPGGLKRVQQLLAAAQEYRRSLRRTPVSPEAGPAFRQVVTRILAKPGSPDPGRLEATTFDRLRQEVASAMERAVREEERDGDRNYPPDIVEVSLLAYAWQVADHVMELYAAFTDLLAPRPATARPAFDREAYRSRLPGFLARLGASGRDASPGVPPSAEETALFLDGWQRYQAGLPVLLGYGLATYRDQVYPDCGETSLRNFFNILFTAEGELSPDRIARMLARFQAAAGTGRLAAVAGYYAKYPTLPSQWSTQARNDWSDIVSNLNQPGDPIAIGYRDKGTHNLMGTGIANMLNLIAHLVPAPVLVQPWPKEEAGRRTMAAAKLNELCRLASGDGFNLSWRAGEDKALPGELLTVTFLIDGAEAFAWEFRQGHYAIHGKLARDHWASALPFRSPNVWLREWCRRFQDPKEAALTEPVRLWGRDLRDPEATNRNVRDILRANDPFLMPSLALLVVRNIPPEPAEYSRFIEILLDMKPETLPSYPLAFFRELPQAFKDRLMVHAVTESSWLLQFGLVEFWNAHGVDPKGRDADGHPFINLAAGQGRIAAVIALIGQGVGTEVRDAAGRTPLHAAAAAAAGEGEQESVFDYLLAQGADPTARDLAGLTPMDLAKGPVRMSLEKALKRVEGTAATHH